MRKRRWKKRSAGRTKRTRRALVLARARLKKLGFRIKRSWGKMYYVSKGRTAFYTDSMREAVRRARWERSKSRPRRANRGKASAKKDSEYERLKKQCARRRLGRNPRLKLKDATKYVSEMGFSLRNRDGEYRLAPKGLSSERAEEMAYYTNDLEDVILTARAEYGRKYGLSSDEADYQIKSRLHRYSKNPSFSSERMIRKHPGKWYIGARSAHDYIPIGPFDSYAAARRHVPCNYRDIADQIIRQIPDDHRKAQNPFSPQTITPDEDGPSPVVYEALSFETGMPRYFIFRGHPPRHHDITPAEAMHLHRVKGWTLHKTVAKTQASTGYRGIPR